MEAKKKHIFKHETNRNAELGFVVSASARIEILEYLDHHQMMNIPVLEQFIPLHKKTLNHHVSLIERSGLIKGFYLGNTYFWVKNEEMLEEWDKIRWTFTSRG